MGFSIELYDIDIATGTYIRKDVIGNFQDLQFFDRKNRVGLARFSIQGQSAKATSANLIPLRTIVAVKSGNTIIWTGFISTIRNTFQNVANNIRVECMQYFGRLQGRHTDQLVRFDQVGQGTIAWNLINYTQGLSAGNLGITQGVTDNSQLRDREYQNYIIAEAIMNLTNVIDGTNFELLPTVDADGKLTGHVFNTYATLGANRFDLPPLTLGSSVISYDAFSDGDIINFTLFKGAGTGDEYITAQQQSIGSQNAFSRNEKYTLREDISEQPTLQSWADRTIAEQGAERFTIEMMLKPNSNLDPFAFRVGDRLKLNIDDVESSYKYIGQCEVLSKEFLVDPQGVLEQNIKVNFIRS